MFKSIVVAMAIFIASCASMTAPRNVQDSAAYALGQVTAMRNTCTSLGEAKKLSPSGAAGCLTQTDRARKLIELAITAPDLASQETALQRALEILTYMEEVLKDYK